MRRACCRLLSSRARSFSIDCRSTAWTMVSSAIRNRLSSPSALIQQGRPMRRTQRDGAAVVVDIRHAGPTAKTKRNACILVLTDRQTVDARNMDDAVRGRANSSRQRRHTPRPFRQTAYTRPAPDVLQRHGADRNEISAVRTDTLRHIGERPFDLAHRCPVAGVLMKRIETPAITCSNAARRRSATARARNCSPRYTKPASSKQRRDIKQDPYRRAEARAAI